MHNPGQVVVTKDNRLLYGTSRQDRLTSAHLVEPVAADHRQPVVREPAVADRIGHDLNPGLGFYRGDELGSLIFGQLALDIEAGICKGAAKHWVFLHQ